MATATAIAIVAAKPTIFASGASEVMSDSPLSISEEESIAYWTTLLRTELNNLFQQHSINETCYDIPRRKDPDPQKANLAISISALLYPAPSDSVLGPLIKYEKDIVLLRRAVVAQREVAAAVSAKIRYKPTWIERIRAQGPWDEVNDPLSLKGAPALPMPVAVSSEETLKPFLEHVRNNGTYENGKAGNEEYYKTEMGEWEKGILYKDGRMDLCKM